VTFDETRVQTITTKVDGWVERLYVDYTGRPVRRGEPLMTIYSPALVTAQEELLLARRLARDVADGDADARAGASELVAAARRRLAYWDVPEEEIARVESTGQVQRTLTLRASAGGVVVTKGVTAGQRVAAGEPLFRVADLSMVWVEGDVYEQDLRAVREGQAAFAEFDAYPGARWTGRIAYVYPTLSPETRTARVRVAFASTDLRLKPGMYATLHIRGEGGAPALSVPRGAVLATGERQLVFVRRDGGRLEPREVRLGAASDDRVQVLRGLALGDTVVASATFLVDAESNLGTALGGWATCRGWRSRRRRATRAGRRPPCPSARGRRPRPRPARPRPAPPRPRRARGTRGTTGTAGRSSRCCCTGSSSGRSGTASSSSC
jgi:Cu(I)/Ag(I) efflux system membrane fusion protein